MSLTKNDLERLRLVIREEIARALSPQVRSAAGADSSTDDDEVVSAEMSKMATELLADIRRKWAEREARPIPNTPTVDVYDAARLLGISGGMVSSYVKRGLLTRTKVKGRLQVSRAEIDAMLASRQAKRNKSR